MSVAIIDGEDAVTPRAWLLLAFLVIVYTVSFIDRQILSILAESVKTDLHLTDAQLGFLYGTAFAIFYALFGIPLGRLADTWHRGWLIAAGMVMWSLMTSLSGLAVSFTMLAVARVGVGIGEASTSPAAYSLIGDAFPERRRATAFAIYASGLYIGLGLSLPVGGAVLSYWNAHYPVVAQAPFRLAAWQATFLLLGLPGFLLALGMLAIRDPAWHIRRQQGKRIWLDFGRELVAILPPLTLISTARLSGELRRNLLCIAVLTVAAASLALLVGDAVQWIIYAIGVYAVFSWVQRLRHVDPETYRLIWGNKATIRLLLAFGCMAFITYAIGFWASPYALRTFYAAATSPAIMLRGGTAIQEASLLIGWGSAIGSALGVVAGGIAADRWREHDPRGRLFTVLASLLLSAPLTAIMFTTHSLTLFYALVPVTTFCSSAWTGPAVATIQGLVMPRMRGTAGATFLLAITLVGLALGPYVAGKIGMVSGSLRTGVLSLFIVAPVIVTILLGACARLQAGRRSAADRVGG